MTNRINVKDENLKNNLEKSGFHKRSILHKEDVDQLLRLYQQEHLPYIPEEQIISHGLQDLEPKQRRFVSNEIIKIFQPYLEKYFQNYEAIVGTYFIKRGNHGKNSVIKPHHDLSLLKNETHRRKIHLWCSLEPVEASNGALYVLEGSHLFFPPVHTNTIPFPFKKIQDTVIKKMNVVSMDAGDGLFLDSRTIHASGSNETGQDRISVIVQLTPPEEEMILFYHNREKPDSLVEVIAQERDCLFAPNWISSKPERPKIGKKIGVLNFSPFTISEEDFLSLVQNPRRYEPYQDFKFEIIDDRSAFRKLFSFFR